MTATRAWSAGRAVSNATGPVGAWYSRSAPCRMGLDGIVSKRIDARSQRAVKDLAQVEKPGKRSGTARARGRLGRLGFVVVRRLGNRLVIFQDVHPQRR